jgi:hypothetical protein
MFSLLFYTDILAVEKLRRRSVDWVSIHDELDAIDCRQLIQVRTVTFE